MCCCGSSRSHTLRRMSAGVIAAYVAAFILAALLFLAVTSRRWERTNERLRSSRVGWIMPGGVATKLGSRDRSPETNWVAYLVGGPLRGWLYNRARQLNADESLDADDVPATP